MSDTQFTPGPYYLDGGFIYSERNRERVKAAKAKDRNCGDGNIPLAKIIADMAGEQLANGHLFTAAPEMVDALVEAKREMWAIAREQWTLADFKNWAVIQQIDAVLAKVRMVSA